MFLRPGDTIVTGGNAEIAIAHLCEVEHIESILLLSQVDGHAFVVGCRFPRVLRCFGAAQIAQCHHGIHQRNPQHQCPILPIHFQRNIGTEGTGIPGLSGQLLDREQGAKLLIRRYSESLRTMLVANPYAEGHACHVDSGQQHVQPLGIRIQVPVSGTKADAVIQYNAFVDEHGAGQYSGQQQNTTIPLDGKRHNEEDKCREQIPFVHLNAQHIQQQEQQPTEEGQISQVSTTNVHGQHNGES